MLERQAEKLAGRGLRYVREDWQIVEQVEQRGKAVEKRRYPEAFEAAEQLYAQIGRARTPEQVIGRLLQALVAAHAADEEALPQSKRVYWETPGSYDDGPSSEIPALLERLAKPVLPRHLAAKRQPGDETDARGGLTRPGAGRVRPACAFSSTKEAEAMASTTSTYGRVWDRRLGELPDPPDGPALQPRRPVSSRRSAGRRSRSSVPAPARATAPRSPAASPASLPPPASPSSPALPAASMAKAHRGALEAGGLTVAVLGCGIDRDYPSRPRRARPPHRRPGRDRLRVPAPGSSPPPGVSRPATGSSPPSARLVVVVEARNRSGALITVDLAMEIGRPIYAVPGEITSLLSEGTNDLIRHGHATALTAADQILAALSIEGDHQ